MIVDELLPVQNMLGLGLNLPVHDVEAIHSTYSNPRDRLLHVIIAFFAANGSYTHMERHCRSSPKTCSQP